VATPAELLLLSTNNNVLCIRRSCYSKLQYRQTGVQNRSYGQTVSSKAPPPPSLVCGSWVQRLFNYSSTVVCSRSGRSPMKTRSTGSFLWFILDQQEPELQCSVLVEHFFPHSSSFQRRSLKPFLKVNHNSRSNISSLGQPSPPRRFC
jgi:hypothetical protein